MHQRCTPLYLFDFVPAGQFVEEKVDKASDSLKQALKAS